MHILHNINKFHLYKDKDRFVVHRWEFVAINNCFSLMYIFKLCWLLEENDSTRSEGKSQKKKKKVGREISGRKINWVYKGSERR